MHYLAVDRRAQHSRKAVVALEGRSGAEFRHLRGSGILQIHGRRAHNYKRPNGVMYPAQRLAGAAHLVDLGSGFDEDRHLCSKSGPAQGGIRVAEEVGCYALRNRCSAASIAAVTASTD